MADLAPQREALQDVVVLPLVAVCQPSATQAAADGEAGARLSRVGAEEMAQVANHAVHRVAVEQQIGVIVADAVYAPQDVLLHARHRSFEYTEVEVDIGLDTKKI